MTGVAGGAARYWTQENDTVHCSLCPHSCKIIPGASGRCGVRWNRDGQMTLPYYGKASALGSDPIEKKPLYHFHPGAQILSIGFLGCNFRCPFCQNYSISQSTDRATVYVAPDDLVSRAKGEGSFGIAYTYNEPSVHFEYVMDAAARAHDAGLKNVLVTNGHLNQDPARELLALMDAANIDLKSYSDTFYRREIGGFVSAVLEFIKLATRLCHVEITTLVIPGKNNSEKELEEMSKFVASLDPNIPYHLSAYYPTYHYTYEATTSAEIDSALAIARKHLNFVYPGNLPGPAVTACSSCGNILIERRGYRVNLPGITNGKCSSCGEPVPIVLD